MHYVTIGRPQRFGLTDEFLSDILTIAAEGGIGYWADYGTERNEGCYVDLIHNIMDAETGNTFPETGGRPGWVSRGKLANAIEQVLNFETEVSSTIFVDRILACCRDNDACDLDIEDCDVLVQIALFGKVIYG